MSNFYRGEILQAEELNLEFSKTVSRSGDTMAGPLFLSRDPQQPTEAVTKRYIDNLPPPQASGVATFNTRIGDVTLTSADVNGALTYVPYNSTNPSGYQTAAQVTTSLGPYALTASVPVAATITPLANSGSGIVGSATKWAREDHAHPSVSVIVTISDSAPTLVNGLLWFDSVGSRLYIGYNDGNSSQWVAVA